MGRKEDGRQLGDPLSKMGNRAQWEISSSVGTSEFHRMANQTQRTEWELVRTGNAGFQSFATRSLIWRKLAALRGN